MVHDLDAVEETSICRNFALKKRIRISNETENYQQYFHITFCMRCIFFQVEDLQEVSATKMGFALQKQLLHFRHAIKFEIACDVVAPNKLYENKSKFMKKTMIFTRNIFN